MWAPHGPPRLVGLAVLVLLTVPPPGPAHAAPADASSDSMLVTVSAGPIAVMEPPPEGLPEGPTEQGLHDDPTGAPSLQALVAAGLRQVAMLDGDVTGSPAGLADGLVDPAAASTGRGRGARDLAGLIRKAAHRFIRSLGDELRDIIEGTGPPAGRRKKGDAWPMLGAGLIMGGTLLTVGLGALAAMAGKALMSAMLALGMSLMSAFRGPPRRCRRSDNGCSNDGSDNYEIIARPVITHGHTHSAVLHHDPGMGMAASPYTGTAYPGYVRSLVQTGPPEQIQAIQTVPSTTVDVTDFARSGATRLINGPSASIADSSSDESNPATWVGSVIGMRSPQGQTSSGQHQGQHYQGQHYQGQHQQGAHGAAGSDGVLSLTLGTWGKQQLQRTTQPRAWALGPGLAPTPTTTTTSTTDSTGSPGAT